MSFMVCCSAFCSWGNRVVNRPWGIDETTMRTKVSSETTFPYNARFDTTTCGQYPGMVHPLMLHLRSTCEKPNTGKLPQRRTETNCSSSPGVSPKTARVVSGLLKPSMPYSYEKGVGKTNWSVVTSSSPVSRSRRKQPNSAVKAQARPTSCRVKEDNPNGVAFPNSPNTRDPCLSTLHWAEVFNIFKLSPIK